MTREPVGHPVRSLPYDALATIDGFTRKQVLGQARALMELHNETEHPVLCVASDDRLDVTVALLSALSGGPHVVFPASLSPSALLEVYAACPYTHWIGPSEWTEHLPAQWVDPTSLRAAPVVEHDVAPVESEVVSLFTGGSTGRPRLWIKRSQHLLTEAAMQVQLHGIGVDDRVLSTVSPHHIYGLLFTLVPWLAGAVIDRFAPFFPQEIAARAVAMDATILISTPAHLRALAALPWTAPRPRLVLSSGAPLAASDAKAFHERVGTWPQEIYGSTETGGVATRAQRVPDCPWLALPGVQWRIAHERLAVRSPYLSDGLPLDEDGFFITADRAVESSAGRFLLQGRVDSIVKVSGQRVDTAEVESRLLALPGVNDAVIVARATDSARGHELLALVASKLSPQTLTLALRQQLPPVAWPRVLRVVQSVPTTPSGKRDLPAINAMLDENRSEAASDETSSAHVVGSHGSSEPPQRR